MKLMFGPAEKFADVISLQILLVAFFKCLFVHSTGVHLAKNLVERKEMGIKSAPRKWFE